MSRSGHSAGCAFSARIRSDRIVVRAGVELSVSILLLDGLMCRYKDLRNGQRQIMELHVPGDFVDLHSFLLKRLDHNVMSLVPSRIAIVPHHNLVAITEGHPHPAARQRVSVSVEGLAVADLLAALGKQTGVSLAPTGGIGDEKVVVFTLSESPLMRESRKR